MNQKMRHVLQKTKHRLKWLKQKGKRTLRAPQRLVLKQWRHRQRKNDYGPQPKRLLIYTIYETEATLGVHKLRFLEGLLPLVKQVLIVVNGHLSQADQEKLASYGQVLYRDNVGYDAAAFRAGILHFGQAQLSQFDQLLLVNDTNIGPFVAMSQVFEKMPSRCLDFWGIACGEIQPDFTGYNPYGYIPAHLQSYFLVIERSLLQYTGFYNYWSQLTDTDSRHKAIGKHETVFTQYFSDLGFTYDALIKDTADSGMYLHPLRMLRSGSPLIKYAALANFDEEQLAWQGLDRKSEIPDLLAYIDQETDYPLEILTDIVEAYRRKAAKREVVIIDGVENHIPQCTRYRVLNKAETLRAQGYQVQIANASIVNIAMVKQASHLIIYRAPDAPHLVDICRVAQRYGRKVIYDIDDLVFDTQYTDQLAYTQGLSVADKAAYDAQVASYGRMLSQCDAAMTTTATLVSTLADWQPEVILNRNVLSQELWDLSQQALAEKKTDADKVKLAYFSGSITHNENFEMILPAILKVLAAYPQTELHLVGHLDVPAALVPYQAQLVQHDYVDWTALPAMIAAVDINLAPLVDSLFNRAKSEIKWLEAAAVKTVTLASRLGAFEEMMVDGETGLLADSDQWETQLIRLVTDQSLRQKLAEQAYDYVSQHGLTQTSEIQF